MVGFNYIILPFKIFWAEKLTLIFMCIFYYMPFVITSQ